MGTVVITGAASGLGAAVRARLEAEGHTVVGVDLHATEVRADLSTPPGRSAAMNEVLDRTGGVLDGLVVCAGLGPHVAPVSRLVSVNYYGAVEVLDGLRPALAAGHRPAAVAVSSNSIGLTPLPDARLVDQLLEGPEAQAMATADALDDGAAVYAMTKIALARAVRRRSLAWGRAGVRINAVAPGPFETPMLAGTREDPVLGPLVEALPIPLERAGRAEEIAAVVAFLLGPDATYVHGSVLFADGGTDALARPEAI